MMKETKGRDGNVVWRVDRSRNLYEYYFNPEGSQGKVIGKMIFKGTTKKPTALNGNGFGFGRPLQPLYRLLKEHFARIDRIIVSKGRSEIRGRAMYFDKDAYEAMVDGLITVYRENSNRLRDVTVRELGSVFPRVFKVKGARFTYTVGTLAAILGRKGIAGQLGDEDISKMVEILPNLMERSAKAKRGLLSTIRIADIGTKAASYELKRTIDQYERLLGKKAQKESEWQDFLRHNMTAINPTYLRVVDKQNIAIKASFPDFLLIDQFQFVDVFEIKRPDMRCLAHDPSHDNHYWSLDATKAIAQVEKYIFQLERNARAVIEDLKHQGVEINLIRPRGYVLIGKRGDLSAKEEVAFRMLNESLKRTQVIFFDDLLFALKSKYTVVKQRAKNASTEATKKVAGRR